MRRMQKARAARYLPERLPESSSESKLETVKEESSLFKSEEIKAESGQIKEEVV